MRQVSIKSSQNATLNRIHRTRPVKARKIIAFHELLNLEKNKKSARSASELLEIPNSTMQSWQKQTLSQGKDKELSEFFSTPVGADFLQRNIMAVMKLMKCGPGGIRGMQEYLQNTGLNKFVASSEGALQNFWVRCEKHIIKFGKQQENKLSKGMATRKITAGLDEIFRGKRPCLVAMDVVSNYILLEKFTEDRTANTWNKELQPRQKELNIEVTQVVSDLCGAICAVTRSLGAEHISELFHAQHEISKAVSAPLALQERALEASLSDAEEKARKLETQPRRLGKEDRKKQLIELEEVVNLRDELKPKYEKISKQREEVKNVVKEMSKIHHPIDFEDGNLQTAEKMEQRFSEQFKIVDKCVKRSGLSQKCQNRVDKARRAFVAIVCYMKYFFAVYAAFVGGLQLSKDQEEFFNNVIFPLSYLRLIWKRLPKHAKEDNKQLLQSLESRARDGPWPEELKEEWMVKGREMSEVFQRSSSCVEGRNSALSLNFQRFRRLNERALQALTIIHNFEVRRRDGTTAAERFFGVKHANLFDSLVTNVRIPGRPKKQNHDPQKRCLGWEKRRIA